jgi:hypothetical protein
MSVELEVPEVTNPLEVVAPVTPVVSEPVVAPAPEPRFGKEDYEKIQSVDDAKRFRDSLTSEEKDFFDKGQLDRIFGDKKSEPVVDKVEDKVEEKTDDSAPEPVDPILNADEYEKADPRTRAMQDHLLETLEKLEQAESRGEDPAVQEMRELIASDPVLKNRIELQLKGEASLPPIDIPPEAFLTEDVMAALDKAFITDDNLASAKIAMKDLIKRIYTEAAFRAKTNVEGEYIEKAAVAERKNWYQSNISDFVRTSKDYSSSEPLFVESESGTSINPKHPFRPVVAWLTDEVKAGRITHEAIKAHGLAAYEQLYRIKTSGSVENFRKTESTRSRKEIMEQIRAAQAKAKTVGSAPTLRPNSSGVPTPNTWNGYDLSRMRVDRGYAESVMRELKSKNDTTKINDLVKMAEKW